MKSAKCTAAAMLLLWGLPSSAQDTLPQFFTCLAAYEAQGVGNGLMSARAEEEIASSRLLPTVSTAVGANRSLISDTQSPQNSVWTTSIRQTLISPSESKAREALTYRIQSENESLKAEILKAMLSQADDLFTLASLNGRIEILKAQAETQQNILNIFKEMVRARTLDGSQMLMAESDLLKTNTDLSDLELQSTTLLRNLKTLPFFDARVFEDVSKLDGFFESSKNAAPVDISQQPEVKALELQTISSKSQLLSETRAWYPKLDVGLEYSQYLDNPLQLESGRDLRGEVLLTIPISELFTRKARKSLYQSEVTRLQFLKERLRKSLQANLESDRNRLEKTKVMIENLKESTRLLLKAREIQSSKLQLNKISYLELAGADDRLNQTRLQLLELKISNWQITTRWQAERIINSFDSTNKSVCVLKTLSKSK